MKKLPSEREQEYIEAWKTHTGEQLAKMFNISEKTVTNTNKRLGLKKGLRDENGKPVKQYVRRNDAYPIGTIVTHHSKANGELKFVINEEGKRVALRVYNWLKAGREIPKGRKIFYIDPSRENRDEIDNLTMKEGRILFRIDIKRAEKREKRRQIEKRKEDAQKKREAKKACIEAARIERERLRAEKFEERQREREEKKRIKEVSEYNHRFKRKEKVWQTKEVDVSKLIPVRIDRKTVVYAKSEADIPRIKQRYSKAS